MDCGELYKRNVEFKRYVDQYAKKTNLSVVEVMEHRLIKEVGKLYGGKLHGEIQ